VAYDNTARQARAQQTRRAVLAAAATAFLDQGYAGTTIRGVAEAAGVSPETVYKTFRNKATLLKAVYDVTLAGDDDPVPVPQRPEALAVRNATTPGDAALAYASLARMISGHVGPLLTVVLGARGTDPDLEAFVAQIDGERLFGATMVTRAWHERGWLHAAPEPEQARDVLWTLNSPAVYQSLKDRGWSDTAYESWLAGTILATILGEPPTS
jgi:AcrR family transcriptional regulator